MKNEIFGFEKIPQSKLINYSDSLVNLSASIEKYCTGESNHTGLSALEPVLKKEYKNIILLLFDGMGMNVLQKFLSPESFIRKIFYVLFTQYFLLQRQQQQQRL